MKTECLAGKLQAGQLDQSSFNMRMPEAMQKGEIFLPGCCCDMSHGGFISLGACFEGNVANPIVAMIIVIIVIIVIMVIIVIIVMIHDDS